MSVSRLFAGFNENGGRNSPRLELNYRMRLRFGGAIEGDGAAGPEFVGGIDESCGG